MDKIMYYLYHIPGKKIGVTRDLNNRVTKQQGYFPDYYEVLDHIDDIVYISKSDTWLNDVCKNMAEEYEVNEVLIESGATFSGAMIDAGLVDELVIYMAPKLFGNESLSLIHI